MVDSLTDTAPTGFPVPQLVIGMPTFRRPSELDRVLPKLLEQACGLRGAEARVVVVDNDPEASARKQTEAYAAPALRYVHEPRPGISAARNRAIEEAEGADAIVYIDDDEVPHPGWLQALVDTWREWGCAAVAGPVNSIFVGTADAWVRGSGVFTSPVRPTGTSTPGASSGNLLLDLKVLANHGIRFDDAFGLSGGSDTMLAHTLRNRGEQIRWCQEAQVSEFVPADRSRRDWVFRRTVRTSNTWSRVAIALAATPSARWRARCEMTARGWFRLLRGGATRAQASVKRDVAADARGAVDIASGLGLLMGAHGLVRYEYARCTPRVKT